MNFLCLSWNLPGPVSALENQRLQRLEEQDPLLTAMSNGDGVRPRAGMGPDSNHAPSSVKNSSAAVAAAEIEMDPGERRLNELGYKQELRREMVMFIALRFHSPKPSFVPTCTML